MHPESRSNCQLHLIMWGEGERKKKERKKRINRQFILNSLQKFSKSVKRNLRNDNTTTASASSPALLKQSWQRCDTLSAKSSGASSTAKEGEVLVKLPDAIPRYFLLYQPCRFQRKVANSWRQRLLIFHLTFPLHSQTQLLTTRDGSCLVKSFPRKPNNTRIQLHSLHLLPFSKQVQLPEPLENKRRKGYKASFWLISSKDDMTR